MWSCWFWVWFKSAHNDKSLQKAEITNPSNFLAHASAVAEVGKNFGGNAAELVLIRCRASHVKSLVSQFLIIISWFFDIDTSAPPLLFVLYVQFFLEPYSSLVKQCGRPRDLGSCVLCACSSHIWVCYVLSVGEGRKRMGTVVLFLESWRTDIDEVYLIPVHIGSWAVLEGGFNYLVRTSIFLYSENFASHRIAEHQTRKGH